PSRKTVTPSNTSTMLSPRFAYHIGENQIEGSSSVSHRLASQNIFLIRPWHRITPPPNNSSVDSRQQIFLNFGRFKSSPLNKGRNVVRCQSARILPLLHCRAFFNSEFLYQKPFAKVLYDITRQH